MDSSTPNVVEQEPPDRPSGLMHRLAVWFISTASYCLIHAICGTLRWKVEGMEHHQSILDGGRKVIFAFWHGRILMATYFWRKRGIVVMTSRSREGDYIAKLIKLFGYGSARGSSSRGGRRALVEMMRELRCKRDVAFTIDGPRGPRYVAKPGAAWLSAKTGDAVLPFPISCRKRWVVSSWDRFHIPMPFSRVLVLIGAPILVRAEATEEELEATQQRIQQSLDELRQRGDYHWGDKPGD